MGRRKILIIDDEAAFGHMLKLNLEETGNYEVRLETQGNQGFETCTAFMPELILLDIIMPDISGLEIAHQIRNDTRVKDIPIVFLTAIAAQNETKDMHNAIAHSSFLVKPVGVQELIACIEKNITIRE